MIEPILQETLRTETHIKWQQGDENKKVQIGKL